METSGIEKLWCDIDRCAPYRLIHVRQCVRVNNENQAMINIDKQIQINRSHKRVSRAATQLPGVQFKVGTV